MILVILLAIAVIFGFIFLSLVIRGSILAGDLFACPNCGHQLLFGQYYTIHAADQARIKCPKCKIRDMCSKKI